MFKFEELDERTRSYMLAEFLQEWARNPYISSRLSAAGIDAYPILMEKAIKQGTESTLAADLAKPAFWKTSETYVRSGKSHSRSIDPLVASEALSISEFNTWYVRGFARRLIEEGEQFCQVYRAAPAWDPRDECLQHDGRQCPVIEIYEGHRARYWPLPGNQNALSIPVGPNCHHTIRRIKKT